MLKKLMGFVALITIAGAMAIPARADTIFSGKFSGSQVLPPNASKATGSATVVLNDTATRVTISLDFSGLGSNQTAAHIHGPARPGGIAPILFNLGSQGTTSGALESLSASVSPRQVAQLKAGLWYFDIHSTRLFGGEIRAQILTQAQAPVENASRGESSTPSLYFSNGFAACCEDAAMPFRRGVPFFWAVPLHDFEWEGEAQILERLGTEGHSHILTTDGEADAIFFGFGSAALRPTSAFSATLRCPQDHNRL